MLQIVNPIINPKQNLTMKKFTFIVALLAMMLPSAMGAMNCRSLQDFEQTLAMNYMTSSASGSIDAYSVTHDATDENGNRGLAFTVDFQVNGAQNVQCCLVVSFYFAGGQPLKDFDGHYFVGSNQVAAVDHFNPPYPNTTYTDYELFMPYDQLHMDAGHHDLEYRFALFVGSTQLAVTDAYGLSFNS